MTEIRENNLARNKAAVD